MIFKNPKIIPLSLLVFTLLTGCESEPFHRPPLPILHSPDPQVIRENALLSLPEQFTSDDSIIGKVPFHDPFAILGVLNVDRKTGTFELYGLSPIGVQFFHISGDSKGVTVGDAIAPLMGHRDILLVFARDIQRMYFDLSPRADAKAIIRAREVDFRQDTAEGTLIYEFGNEPTILLEKRLEGYFGTIWQVRYYQYLPGAGGKLFPHGIVMDNYRYHYRIIVKNRDWSVEE